MCIGICMCDEQYVISDISQYAFRTVDQTEVTWQRLDLMVVEERANFLELHRRSAEYTGGKKRPQTDNCQMSKWSELEFGPYHSFGHRCKDDI